MLCRVHNPGRSGLRLPRTRLPKALQRCTRPRHEKAKQKEKERARSVSCHTPQSTPLRSVMGVVLNDICFAAACRPTVFLGMCAMSQPFQTGQESGATAVQPLPNGATADPCRGGETWADLKILHGANPPPGLGHCWRVHLLGVLDAAQRSAHRWACLKPLRASIWQTGTWRRSCKLHHVSMRQARIIKPICLRDCYVMCAVHCAREHVFPFLPVMPCCILL